MRILLRGGRLVRGNRVEPGDLLLEDGRIAALGQLGGAAADRVLELEGAYVLPGFIDVHTHLEDRIGRFDLADTYASGSEIAILNGITTLFTFITQRPGESLATACRTAQAKASGRLRSDMAWHLTPTRFDDAGWREIDACLEQGYRTFKFYTTYREAGLCSSYDALAGIFARLKHRASRILVHAEDDDLLASAAAELSDLSSPSAHARLRPELAENSAAGRVARLARIADLPLHVVHVSAVATARLLAELRTEADLSFETCPQYLELDESWLSREHGHRWICSPPLRKDRETFRDLAHQGLFDIFATDHCAFRAADKDDWNRNDIRTVASGLPGLGALPHVVFALFAGDPKQAVLEMARTLSEGPARLMGLSLKGRLEAGLDADVIVMDPAGPEGPIRSTLSDAYDPYAARTTRLEFRHVFLRGVEVARSGRLRDPDSFPGRSLVTP